MADAATRGKDIADAYRNWTGDDGSAASSGGDSAASNDNAVSRGAAIADAYRTQGTDTPPPATSASGAPTQPFLRIGNMVFDAPESPLQPDLTTRPSPPSTAAPPSTYTPQYGVPQEPAAQRIRQAAIDAFNNAPTVLTPEARAAVEQNWFGRNLLNPALDFVSTGVADVSAAGAAGVATVNELMREAGVNPRLRRDLNIAAVAAPATAAVEGAPMRAGLANRPSAVAEAPPPAAAYTPEQARVAEVTGRRPGEAPAASVNALDEKAAAAPAPPPPAENVLEQATKGPSGRITPIVTQAQAEAEADRIIQHFAAGGSTNINSAPLASGAQPTLSQSVVGGNAGLAVLERGVREVPEQTTHFVGRETANTTARNKAVGDVIGDSRATDVVEAELNDRTKPQEKAIFDPARTQPVDTSATVAKLDEIRNGPAGERDAVADGLDHLRTKLFNQDGTMKTDPALLRGVDQSIGDMIGPKAMSTKHDFRAAAHELMEVREVLRGDIEQGASGYRDFLATQAAERSAIDGQRFLQARNITDRQGNVNLGTLDSTIKAAERQQRMPGARLADGVTDEQLDRLRALRDDYRNDAKQRLGTALGSPTVQKLGVSGSMALMGHPLLAGGIGYVGTLAAGANPLIAAGMAGVAQGMKMQSLKGQRMVMDALRDKLLNPDKARSAFKP